MIADSARVPLARRAWLGDGSHGALVSADGSVDWYLPRGLAAPPELWRLLDERGPAVRVGPVRAGSDSRRSLPEATIGYRSGTNVVETVAAAAAGRRVRVTDFLPWPGPGLAVTGSLVRLVRALSGPVEVEVEVLTGPERDLDGRPRRVAPAAGGLRLGPLHISAGAPFAPAPLDRDTGRWRAVVRLDSGEETVVVVGLDGGSPLGVAGAHRLLDETETAWRSWAAHLAYRGPYRASVERSLLAVRALTGPGGAPAAAGTTSLPRRPGSERQADDRWVRLRDVARAVRILAAAGLVEDAGAAEGWLRRTVDDAHLPWPAWFDADGQPVPTAEELPWTGWRRAQPVQVGRAQNAPPDAGLVGEVAAAAGASSRGPGGRPDDPGPLSAAWAALAEATDWAADHWEQPDGGRWEIERPGRLYVAGRLEVWSALDTMGRLARQANPLDLQAAAWQQEGRRVLDWLEGTGVGGDGALLMAPGTDEPDTALLPAMARGPWPATHRTAGQTLDRALERLGAGALLYRYSERVADERAGPDNPDIEASLLAATALARLGRWDEAHERLEAVISLAPATPTTPGLLGETADPVSGELLGNLPSTAAGLALAETALALEAGPR